jgi:hypothetical protein
MMQFTVIDMWTDNENMQLTVQDEEGNEYTTYDNFNPIVIGDSVYGKIIGDHKFTFAGLVPRSADR